MITPNSRSGRGGGDPLPSPKRTRCMLGPRQPAIFVWLASVPIVPVSRNHHWRRTGMYMYCFIRLKVTWLYTHCRRIGVRCWTRKAETRSFWRSTRSCRHQPAASFGLSNASCSYQARIGHHPSAHTIKQCHPVIHLSPASPSRCLATTCRRLATDAR